MMRASVVTGDLLVDVWYAQGTGHPNQDRWLVQPFGQRTRLAVLDGVTPWRSVEHSGDAGQWAAATVARHLSVGGDLRTQMNAANAELHDPALVPSRRQAMAAVAASDAGVSAAGAVSAQVVVAADCEVWVADESGTLTLAAGGKWLTPAATRAYDALYQMAGDLEVDDLLRREAELLDDPGTQTCHAVGRFPVPAFVESVAVAPTLVLCSDGACLAQAVTAGTSVCDLDDWLATVTRRPHRDDLTCITARVARR
jgi:hypothetical protein